jgi:hypothetical protein
MTKKDFEEMHIPQLKMVFDVNQFESGHYKVTNTVNNKYVVFNLMTMKMKYLKKRYSIDQNYGKKLIQLLKD